MKYTRYLTTMSSLKSNYYIAAKTHGMMDALPMFQEIASPVSSMQTLDAGFHISKTRRSLGGVEDESGFVFNLHPYSYFASVNGKYMAFPSINAQADLGFLLPVGQSNSFWIRSSLGQSLGSTDSSFGYQYLGGFRNSLLDNGSAYRYRELYAFPGAKIDAISARSFAKIMGELMFTPIRLREVGSPLLYPSHITFSLFSSDLLANPWGRGSFANYVNVGAQMNIEMVLFSYMKTTWSFGYAHCFGPAGTHGGELLFSLKLF